jgi:hypothetical protein
LCTCKAAAKRSNVYVSGKNNKILPILETMQPARSQRKKGAKKTKKKLPNTLKLVNTAMY